MIFEVESLGEYSARADVALAIVHAGWNLLELKSSTQSLEEVYLQLTGSNAAPALPTVDGGVQ